MPPKPTSDNGFSQIKSHPQYFIPTGDTQFLAQSVLFKVHRHFFERESISFREIFSGGDGNTKPYTLDVQPEEFAHFLWVFYDEDFEYENQPLEKWLVILRLATRWGFHKMRKLVVRQLEKLDLKPIDKIKIYSDFNIDAQLLLPSYSTLAMSPTLPPLSEASKLDIETILKLTMVRERAVQRSAEKGCRSPTSASAGDEEVRRIICDIFQLARVNNASVTEPPKTGDGDGVNGTAGDSVPTIKDPVKKRNKDKGNANGTPNANGANANTPA
ncbi:hypothetical protein DEU56DRAFT_473136 [Suillus clintonianus]|uniref:uncharacterized protein n=1 Tax=Suillus clintonianus TaxID=1904413 RepID=UPI001B863F62|nr:uncharacterized protein DEU56DRAFT_473136 [Suillus clintonianus]KAG2153213.1 hypothetical protein DEU56DRAFT_473136 [Suillus clintonianus]